LLLVNPTRIQALRGRNTGFNDGERISDFATSAAASQFRAAAADSAVGDLVFPVVRR